MKTIELKRGDTCPACHGELKPAYVPTDDELRKAADRENPVSLPVGADTASKDQREELGELHRCTNCGYVTRFAHTADDGHDHEKPAASESRPTGAAATRPDPGRASDQATGEPESAPRSSPTRRGSS